MTIDKPRRDFVPGVAKLLSQNRELKKTIDDLDNKIESCRSRIKAIIRTFKENDPKQELYLKKNQLNEELKVLFAKKGQLIDEKSRIYPDYSRELELLKAEKASHNIRSKEDLDRRERDIKLRIIGKNLSSVEEKALSNELVEIKRKRKKMNMMKESEANFEILKKKMNAIYDDLKLCDEMINAKKREVAAIQKEIDVLNANKPGKLPEIEELEAQIAAFMSTRKDLLEKKKMLQAEMDKIYDSYKKFKAALEEQKKIEEEKDKLKLRIRELSRRKDELSQSKKDVDPKKFDSITTALKKLETESKPGGKIDLSPTLIQGLCALGSEIPKTKSEIGECIRYLEENKIRYAKSVTDRVRDMDDEIKALDNQMKDVLQQIEKMPVTDIGALKKKFGIYASD